MRIVWFGHSAFRLEFDDKVVLIDPFFTGNPSFTGDRAKAVAGATHILVTHGHSDHVGDTVEIAAETGATVVAGFEVCAYLANRRVAQTIALNTGGMVDQDGFTVTLVRADHSAAIVEDGTVISLGSANGIILKAPGQPTVYHMGDTDIFGDMALIAELHQPTIAMVPIGDRFTMGPETAALALRRFFQLRAVIPCHYGSFPMLLPVPDRFIAAMEGSDTQVVIPHIGTGVTV